MHDFPIFNWYLLKLSLASFFYLFISIKTNINISVVFPFKRNSLLFIFTLAPINNFLTHNNKQGR